MRCWLATTRTATRMCTARKCALWGGFHPQDITHNPSPLTMRFILLSLLNADKNPQGSSYSSRILLEHECSYLLFYLICAEMCCVHLCGCHRAADQSKIKYIFSDYHEPSHIMVRVGYFIYMQHLIFHSCPLLYRPCGSYGCMECNQWSILLML